MTGIEFLKGHGTQNDFVVLPDPDVALSLDADFVSTLCDRQPGLGADGVLRVATGEALVRAGVLPGLPAGVASGDWFMDYRNADGSIAEMCGNGVRVFAHYLMAAGLVDGPEFAVGSRAGARPVTVHSADADSADVSVQMGPVRLGAHSKATIAGRTFAGIYVDVGNPHLACVEDGLGADELAAIDLNVPTAELDSMVFPNGGNVEVISVHDESSVAMRVLERGSGETRSCGTGTVAAAAAALLARGESTGEVAVHIPGGVVQVQITDDGSVLRGPSRLVARGTLTARAL